MVIPFWITPSGGYADERSNLGNQHQVVADRGQKLESRACDPTQRRARETTDGLGPAERLLSALAFLLADRITRMVRRARSIAEVRLDSRADPR